RHVLPVAPARYEALPIPLAEGSWLVSVGAWVVRLRLELAARPAAEPPGPDDGQQVTTRAGTNVRRGSGAGEDAGARGPAAGGWQRDAEDAGGSRLGPPLLSLLPRPADTGPGATASCRRVRYRPKLSNSPFCTPPRKACHSSGVNARIASSGCLLLRTPTP